MVSYFQEDIIEISYFLQFCLMMRHTHNILLSLHWAPTSPWCQTWPRAPVISWEQKWEGLDPVISPPHFCTEPQPENPTWPSYQPQVVSSSLSCSSPSPHTISAVSSPEIKAVHKHLSMPQDSTPAQSMRNSFLSPAGKARAGLRCCSVCLSCHNKWHQGTEAKAKHQPTCELENTLSCTISSNSCATL